MLRICALLTANVLAVMCSKIYHLKSNLLLIIYIYYFSYIMSCIDGIVKTIYFFTTFFFIICMFPWIIIIINGYLARV